MVKSIGPILFSTGCIRHYGPMHLCYIPILLPFFFTISMSPWMMNLLSNSHIPFLLVAVLSHLLVTRKTWMVSGFTSKTCLSLFLTSVHHLHHRIGMPLLLSWLKFSRSSMIFKHLLVSILMWWIPVSLGLKIIWVLSGVALIHQHILSYFLIFTSLVLRIILCLYFGFRYLVLW